MSEEKVKIGTLRTIAAILLALVILVMAQTMSQLIGSLAVSFGMPLEVGYFIAGILYPVLTFLGIKLLCTKLLKMPVSSCKMPRFSVRPIWVAAAVIMPCLVSLVLCMTPGHWENHALNGEEISQIVAGAVFFYGIGTGLVEEMIFRGVIMSTLENRCNRYVAIFAPSVLFGLLHIIGNELDWLSIIQLIIAGSVVGILFSLVTYESGTVWNSAVMHGIWNTVMIGGILQISGSAEEFSIYNYVLDTESFLITGGDFGVEASIISILAYAGFIGLALMLMKRKEDT